jgi:N-carbamoyl-L-amino-acid hydrolase
MAIVEIDSQRLISRLNQLGDDARDDQGVLSRTALSDQDKSGRDMLIGWMEQAGLTVSIDAIGNIFGTWDGEIDRSPLMIGSHIDSVVNAGIYDGCYGVLAGLAVIEALREQGISPAFPIVVVAFTNEEGNRYAPDMMGSLVHAGGLDLEQALATSGIDGSILGEELERIGYAGEMVPGSIKPRAYLEIHIEQGPVLEVENISIGAVENLQGISWQSVEIDGVANHAGTTPTRLRHDAGLSAARITTFLRDQIANTNPSTVATVGSLKLKPSVINVIPSSATMTVDLRDPDEARLQACETRLAEFLDKLSIDDQVTISTRQLARFEPVEFDLELVEMIEQASVNQGLSCKRMTSGAGHDAQMMARICPSAMIFVPSVDGVSHNPREYTAEKDLLQGVAVLLEVTAQLVLEKN